jgi:hypothetical protein
MSGWVQVETTDIGPYSHLGVDSIAIEFYPRRANALCGACAHRLRATDEAAGLRQDQTAEDSEVPVREST